jgi:RNA polymerase sigma-70 factor (ECF subfamily)
MSSPDITVLLKRWSNGDPNALDQLMPAVYDELRTLAAAYLRRESAGHTLQSTALVNEAYLRLVNQNEVQWQNRSHFFGIAARMLRRVLVDHARGRKASKRGGAAVAISLDEQMVIPEKVSWDVVAVDDALNSLCQFDEQQAKIVELRFFGGLSIAEIAAVLGVSASTVKREWLVAKAWLTRELIRHSTTGDATE